MPRNTKVQFPCHQAFQQACAGRTGRRMDEAPASEHSRAQDGHLGETLGKLLAQRGHVGEATAIATVILWYQHSEPSRFGHDGMQGRKAVAAT